MAEWLSNIISALRGCVPDDELRETAFQIAEAGTGLSRTDLLLGKDTNNNRNEETERITACVQSGMPLQYAIGTVEWGGLQLRVTPDTLIPRPETWELVCLAQEVAKGRKGLRVADIGTGTGCIAIALKQRYPDWVLTACDISETAIAVARENAVANAAEVEFVCKDILTERIGTFDIVISNPPYIPCRERAEMDRRVTDYEPERALFVPDEDPLLFYRVIGMQQPAPWLCFETHKDYGRAVATMLEDLGYKATVRKDFAGHDRYVIAGR